MGKLLAAVASTTAIVIVGATIFLPFAAFVTHLVHETGHGLACEVQGGTVPDWWVAVRPSGSMDCKPTIDVLTTVGGPMLQLFVWITLTLAFTSWASYWKTVNGWQAAIILFWLAWSIWNVRQPISWMNHMTPTDGTNWDPARFIQLTHVSSTMFIAGSWAVLGLLLVIATACMYTLLRPSWAAIKQLALESPSQ
jgi:hypothetical protein